MHADDGTATDGSVPYRPLAASVGAGPLEAHLRDELAVIEHLEAELQRLVSDPRVERRLRNDARRRDRPGARRQANAAPERVQDGRTGLRPPSRAEAERYGALVERLEDLQVPRTSDELAELHARLVGAPFRARYRSVPAETRGRTTQLAAPNPVHVSKNVDEVLAWAHKTPLHPVLVGALVCGEMLAIRPFKDADAALARLLMRIVLQKNGLGAAGNVAVDTHWHLADPEPLDHLARSIAAGDPTAWCRYATETLRDDLQATLDDARFAAATINLLNERQWRLAEWLRRAGSNDPGVRWRFRDVHAAFPATPARTLKRDLATLREAGILRMDGKLKSARYAFAWGAARPAPDGETPQ